MPRQPDPADDLGRAQELGEIQVPYDSTAYWENDTGPYPRPYFLQHDTSATGDPNPLFGQVLYGPGVAVDQPLSVIRFNYTDRPNQGAVATTWPTFTLLPQWNHRGAATFGVFSTGVGYKSYDGVDQVNCPILGDTTGKRCVVVQWVAGQSAYDQQRGGQEKLSWFGTVIEGKRDGVGLEYKRNRYYDPQAGRFRQGARSGWRGGSTRTGSPVEIRSISVTRLDCAPEPRGPTKIGSMTAQLTKSSSF